MPKELEKVLDSIDTPVETEIEPTADTDTETAPAETVTEPAEPNEYQRAFIEAGLDRQFSNPLEAIQRIPDFNRFIDSAHKRNLALEQELAEAKKPKPEPPSADRFREQLDIDPLGAFREAGLVSRDELTERDAKIERMEMREHRRTVADSISEYPELKNVSSGYRINQDPLPGMNKHWDIMNQLMKGYPGLDRAPVSTILSMLMPEARKIVAAQAKPPVEKVPEDVKAGARGTAPGKTGSTGTPDFSDPKWTPDKIKEYYAFRGQYL